MYSEPISKQSRRKAIVSLVLNYVIVFAIAYLVSHVFFQQYIVDGSSMTPNLHTSERLWVDRVTYNFRSPQRGEIVVLKYPLDTSKNYVKRMIGLPGETVVIADGKVKIINSGHPEGFFLTEPYVDAGNLTYLHEGEGQTFVVPADEYFVLGDNRMGSSDSREWGFLPKTDLVGRAVLRTYPLNVISLIRGATY